MDHLDLSWIIGFSICRDEETVRWRVVFYSHATVTNRAAIPRNQDYVIDLTIQGKIW
jgi:hypothetical protein